MKQTIQNGIIKASQAGLFMALTAQRAFAAETDCNVSGGVSGGANCAQPTKTPDNLFGANSIFSTIADVLIFIVGAIAVIMLIVGGLRYVISGGDPKNVEGAKNTIFYAIIGIVVAILAFAAVRFVTGQFDSTN